MSKLEVRVKTCYLLWGTVLLVAIASRSGEGVVPPPQQNSILQGHLEIGGRKFMVSGLLEKTSEIAAK